MRFDNRSKRTANRHKGNFLLSAALILNSQFLILNCFSQEESSPILEQKEKQSELKKIKSCEGIFYSYEKNGMLSKEGREYSFETYNKSGDLIETILYSPEEKISEITQSSYDSTGKLLEEEKIIPNQRTQKHVYYYKNGLLDYGNVHIDSETVHTCTYYYDNNRLSEIIVEHHIAIEKDVPAQEIIVCKYDDKGNKIREDNYEINLSSERMGSDGNSEKPMYKVIKLISSTSFIYDNNSRIIQSSQFEEKTCVGKTEFKYDAKGNMTEEIYYKDCADKPEYVIKYEYIYY